MHAGLFCLMRNIYAWGLLRLSKSYIYYAMVHMQDSYHWLYILHCHGVSGHSRQ